MTPEELAAQQKAEADALAAKAAQEAASAEEARKKAEEEGKNKGDDLSKMTPEELRSRLEKEISERQAANREAQGHRKKLNEYEAAEKKRAEAEMTDLQKAQARAKELEETNAKMAKESQDARILVAATRLGFNDANDAVTLLKRADLADDEKNLDDLLKAMLKSKPYLGKAEGGRGLPKGVSGQNPGGGTEQAGTKEGMDKARTLFPTLRRLIGH